MCDVFVVCEHVSVVFDVCEFGEDVCVVGEDACVVEVDAWVVRKIFVLLEY